MRRSLADSSCGPVSALSERKGPAKPVPTPTRTISPARLAAFEVLQRVEETSSHSDDLLHGPALARLSQIDKDLAHALVMGVLRWQIALDGRIRPLLSRPDAALATTVSIALRLGAFQLLHMERIPAHAALNESVELVRAAGHAHAAGMVNAVLRKLVGAAPPRRPLVEPVPAMAERLGHPEWLVTRWVGQYGRAAAEAICAFDQQEPGCPEVFGPEPAGRPELPLMDPGSRLVAELAAAACPGASRVWDCCAAPGGKALMLARRLTGSELLATDTNPARLRRLHSRLERELPGQSVHVEQADAAVLPSALGSFDLVLCDVPCSGTGTLARNPEIRHRLKPDEFRRQADRQARILAGALNRLAPGGRLLYSTCSLEGEECEAVVERVLREAGITFKQLPIRPLIERLQSEQVLRVDEAVWSRWLRDGSLRTLPGAGFEGDGFFASLLCRV